MSRHPLSYHTRPLGYVICGFWILFDGGNGDPAWGFAPWPEVRIGADFLGPRLLGASLDYAFGEASAGEGGEEVGYYEGGAADEEDVFLGVDCLEGFFVGFGYSFGDQPAV